MTGLACKKFFGVLMASMMIAAACSGGDDPVTAEDSPLFDDEANAPIEQIDEGSAGVAAGPIDGLLIVQPSFGFGAYSVDPLTGQAAAIPGVAAVETVDRDNDVIVSGDAAFAIGRKTREGQTFASDVSIVKFDYTTGEARQLAALGFDRETDGDDLTSHRLVAVAGSSVVVSAGSFGSGDRTYTVYDAETGAETGSFEEPRYEFEGDNGSCSGGVADLVGLSDGRLIGTALNSPALVDLENGEIELLIGCDEDDPELIGFVAPANVNDYAVFNVGSAPSDDDIERLLMTDVEPEHGFVEGDGDLWWITASSRTVNETEAIVGGVVQFDLASQSVEAVHPLGEHLGAYLDCGPDSDSCLISTIAQADMRYIDARLVIVDRADNGRLLTLDPATGDITSAELERRGVDYTSAEMRAGDRSAIWLEVRRMTVVSDDENGRSSAGESYMELVDPATGQVTLSIAGEDLFS